MSDEPVGAEPEAGAPVEPVSVRFVDAGILYRNSADGGIIVHIDAETIGYGIAVTIFAKAFLEELGKRAGAGLADLPKRVTDSLRIRKEAKKGKPDELHVSSNTVPFAAALVITEDLPELARLALIDLDVTAKGLLGRTLRWNAEAGAWLPEDDEESPFELE